MVISQRRRYGRTTWCLAACGLGAAGVLTGTASSGPIPAQPAMGDPLAGLTAGELERFFTGKVSFTRDFTEEEGLGPIFNQTSCGDCHLNPTGGTGTQKVLRAGLQTKAGFDPLTEFGGTLFQLEAISEECREDPPPEANVFTERVTNGMMGYGLVQAILDGDIEFWALNPPSANVSGVVHWVGAVEDPPKSPLRAGRFGWKADVATMMTFSAGASLNEIGITTPLKPVDNDPNGIDPPLLEDCDSVADPEEDMDFLNELNDYQRFLAAPPQTPRSGMSGEVIFNAIGCTDCHIAQWTTPDDPALEPAIRDKTIRPYSDFLLHDMGLAGDGIPAGTAGAQELKTPPLMGLRRRASQWHDGRFESGGFAVIVASAIAEHDDGVFLSEGRFAAQAYAALTPADQAAVLAFLESLGQREFDANGDDQVTLLDFANSGDPATFTSCYLGTPTPDDACAIHDVDQNALVDQPTDFATFLTVYTGQLSDCNQNNVLDMIEILDGTLIDADNNGVPDSCEPSCLADIDGSGTVGILDFMAVLSDWGPCPELPAPCENDFDRDGVVGIVDFLLLLGRWGPCL
ncbi:MAG: hypothetical protein IID28_10460 [Planctomycetes bacterium]|nr:hypothetical protein [Planctomycetota bacterium]